MREFQNGWVGLKDYCAGVGVCEASDTDDVAARAIKSAIQNSLPEGDREVPQKSEKIPQVPDSGESTPVLSGIAAAGSKVAGMFKPGEG